MIQYTVSDVIMKAEQLSDLENSSFLSWNEKISRLNDAYSTLYQTVINHNDKYFYKSFTLSNVKSSIDGQPASYTLPSDFYQLASIHTVPDCTEILRKSDSESEKCLRYDIVNGELMIYGYCVSNIKVSYWPIPDTLTFKNEDVKLSSSYTFIDCCNDNYIYLNNVSNELCVYNINTDSTTILYSLKTGYTNTFAKIGINNIIMINKNSTENEVVIIDAKNYSNIYTTSFTLSAISYGIAKADKKVYFELAGQYIYVYWDRNGTQNVVSNVHTKYPTSFIGCSTFDQNEVPYWCSNGKILYDDGKEYATAAASLVEIIDDDVYYDDMQTGKIYKNLNVINDDESNISLVGINKIDCNTGYGLTIYRDGSYYIVSPFADTELNYPSTFYFTYLSYMLAIQFKIKQNADITLLSSEASEAETAYYNRLDNDSNADYRIKNVYKL